ncbi:MAG: transcriptional regulator [Acidimicrobiales bacterium]
MGHGSEPRLLALLALRLAGFAEADRIAAAGGIDPTAAAAWLATLDEEGLARRRDGTAAGVLSGWSLTPTGRAETLRLLATEAAATGCRPVVEDSYRRFLALNRPLLETTTAWQVRDGRVNDHSDRRYDQRILDELAAIDAKIEPVLADLTACLDRYRRYRPRLTAALARAQAGERAYVDRPLIDSYHTVWFELHEDLLATLGLERSSEPVEVS